MKLSLSLAALMATCLAPTLIAQEEDKKEETPRTWEDAMDEVRRDAVTYDPLEGPTRKRNVTDVETLFDGEHLKPFEVPYDVDDPEHRYTFKENALLGSWSLEARMASLSTLSDEGEKVDGVSAFGRLRFGPIGADVNFSDWDRGRGLDKLWSARALVDMDLYQWLNVRVALGYSNVELEAFEDDGFTFGGELEIYPFKPISIEIHHSEYSLNPARVKDSYIGLGFFPFFLFESDDYSYPTFVPELRIGWRRIVGPAGTTNSNFLVLEAAIEF